MCFGGDKKTETTNSQTAANTANTAVSAPTNPTIDPAVTDLVTSAQSLASQPLQPYTGQLVAPLTDTQNSAIGQIKAAGGLSAPYLQQAADYAAKGAAPITQTPFSRSAVDQYLSPYLDDVVNSTSANIDESNAQQVQALHGNVTAAGAWGGDRSAVLDSELARQQDLAKNQTIASLRDAGYSQALGQFNTTNQLGLQTQQANNATNQGAAATYAGLGAQAQNSALTNAEAQLNAGTLEQQVNQENLNVPYEQYQQAQAYPYQSLNFLSGILGSAAGTSGTTTNQTGSSTGTSSGTDVSKTSSPIGSQLLGLGLSAASFIPGLASGGRARLAGGGMSNYRDLPHVPSIDGYVPAIDAAGHGLQPLSAGNAPEGPKVTFSGSGSGSGSSGNGMAQGAGLGNAVGNLFKSDPLEKVSVTPQVTSGGGFFGGGGNSGFLGLSGAGGLFDGLSGAASFLGLQDGGRARLAHGGTDDSLAFDRIVNSLYPGPAKSAAPPTDRTMSLQDTPPQWRNQATNYGDDNQGASLADKPAYDDGTPVSPDADSGHQFGNGDVWSPHPAKIIEPAYTAKPDWRRALLTAGTSMMAAHTGNGLQNVGAGFKAGADEYYDELDKDNHPEVDHSGPTTVVRYHDGPVVDTGLPTEAALNARASNDYKMANMQQISADRKAAIQQRAEAAAAAVEQRKEAADAAAANRALMLEIARSNAGNGRFGGMQPGKGKDADGNLVDGIYTLNEKTGTPVFTPGATLTAKPTAPKSGAGLSPSAAVVQARKDFATFQAQDKANGGTGTVYNSDGSVADADNWVTNRAGKYMAGAARNGLGGAPQVATPAAAAPVPAAAAPRQPPPPRPQTVPAGAQYSPSRHMWRDGAGKLYNSAGQPLGQ